LLELDGQRRICATSMEAASQRTGIPRFSYEQIAARFPQSQLPALSSRRRTRAPQRVL